MREVAVTRDTPRVTLLIGAIGRGFVQMLWDGHLTCACGEIGLII